MFVTEDHEQSDLLVANPNHPPPSDSDSEPGSESEGKSVLVVWPPELGQRRSTM